VNAAEHDLRARTEAVLEARARIAARPLAAGEPSDAIDTVCFSCGAERYAIEVSVVRRIARLPHVTRLPGAPRHIAGVANLRGRLVPIVDLGRLLGSSSDDEASHVVEIGSEGYALGILAGAVTGIEALPRDAAGSDGRPRMRSVVHRVLADGRALIDGAALLADPRLTVGTTGDHQDDTRSH